MIYVYIFPRTGILEYWNRALGISEWGIGECISVLERSMAYGVLRIGVAGGIQRTRRN